MDFKHQTPHVHLFWDKINFNVNCDFISKAWQKDYNLDYYACRTILEYNPAFDS